MIIDAHSHLGYKGGWYGWWKSDVNEEKFIEVMDEYNIDISCVSHWGINYNPAVGNKKVAKFAENYPDRIIGFQCIVPLWEDAVDRVVSVKEMGMKGIKLHPASNKYYADTPAIYPVVEKAIELDMPMLFHCGHDEYSNPRNLANLAKRYKEGTFIMAHMGEGSVFNAIPLAGDTENIILDTTGSENWYNILQYAIRFVGEDRIVFGRDFPAYNPGPEISKVADANITDKQKEKIFFKNIARILKLEI